jgi:hypothetical protein
MPAISPSTKSSTKPPKSNGTSIKNDRSRLQTIVVPPTGDLGLATLGIPERTEIEFFDGPHTINGVGTHRFLHELARAMSDGRPPGRSKTCWARPSTNWLFCLGLRRDPNWLCRPSRLGLQHLSFQERTAWPHADEGKHRHLVRMRWSIPETSDSGVLHAPQNVDGPGGSPIHDHGRHPDQ